MKAREIRSIDGNTINEKMIELKKDLLKINAQVAVGTALKNPGKIKKIKKTLARILTINYEKENARKSKIFGTNFVGKANKEKSSWLMKKHE